MAVLRVVVTQSTESLLGGVAMRSYFPLRIFRNCLRHPWIRILDLHRAQFRVPTNIAVLPTGSMHPEPIAVTHKGPDGSGKDPSAPAVPGDLLCQFEFTLDLTGRRIVVYR